MAGINGGSQHPAPTAAQDAERQIRETIRAAAPKHIELLQTIANTGVALHEFQNNVAKLEHLEKELKVQSESVNKAKASTQAKLAQYTKEKDSFARRWAYILARKRRILEQKIKESERVYLQAISTQSQAEQRERRLRQDKEVIENANVSLVVETEKHGAAHAELDELYHQVFDGPTPGFPDEDEQEEKYNTSKRKYEATKASLMAFNKTTKDIALVHSTIAKAQKENNQARYELEAALFDGSEEARIYLDRCARLIDQTIGVSQRIDELLPTPLELKYTKTHQTLDRHLVVARNAARSPHGPLQVITDELTLARDAETELMKIVKGYEFDAKKAIKEASRELENSRQALQEVRQNAFEITVGHGASAPAYHECCDRANQFESAAHEAVDRMQDPIIDDSGLPPPPSYETITGDGAETHRDAR